MAEVFRRKQALRFYCTGIQDFFASVRRTCAFAIFVCMLNILASTPSTLAMDAERLHLRQYPDKSSEYFRGCCRKTQLADNDWLIDHSLVRRKYGWRDGLGCDTRTNIRDCHVLSGSRISMLMNETKGEETETTRLSRPVEEIGLWTIDRTRNSSDFSNVLLIPPIRL